ncbi:MAG: type II secretion system F family protein, partial [Clostridiales bacterium]|nr:type II secretion system F family protein [Candidatus Blautia equi]
MKLDLKNIRIQKKKKMLDNQELLNFFEPLGMILHSGISAVEGIELLKEDSADDESRELLTNLLSEMEMTGRLSSALTNTGLFPADAVSYIEVGEETGCLDEVLQSLAVRYEQELELAARVRSAVTYPLVMLGMMGIVIILLLVKVLPVFQQVFRQMGMEMNGVSASLLRAGNAISRYAVFFLILLAVVILVILYIIFTEKGRDMFRRFLLKIPALRGI